MYHIRYIQGVTYTYIGQGEAKGCPRQVARQESSGLVVRPALQMHACMCARRGSNVGPARATMRACSRGGSLRRQRATEAATLMQSAVDEWLSG